MDETLTLGAVVVCDAAPESDDWYATRRAGITATDLPKILGLSGYGNALSVFHDKRGDLPPDAGGPAARWGHLLEDVVAQAWAQDHGVTVTPVGILANRKYPWRLAALDRIVETCPDGDGPCWLEVKCRSAFKAGAWRDDVPDDVLAQVAWQRIVTGLDHGHVAVLIGGNDLREFRYDRDDAVENLLIDEATTLWHAIRNGTPPVVDATSMLLDLLDRLHPNRAGSTPLDRDTYLHLKAEYDEAADIARYAEGGKDWAKYRAVALLGPGSLLVAADDPDVVLATYKPQLREHCDLDALKRDHPDAYKATVRKKPTKPSLLWKTPKETNT